MDEKSLQTLEFPKILARLAEYADFSASHELALAMKPTDDLQEARMRQRQTAEARELFETAGHISVGGARDVRPLLPRALRMEVLLTSELLDVRATLESARNLQRAIGRSGGAFPILGGIAARVEPCTHVINEIARCLNERGEVQDGASDKLARIRRDLRISHDRLMSMLERLVTSPENQPYLQEPLVTQRNGRYVIPLKAEFRGRIHGLVHDQSASGATLFIEPLATVEANNAWRELQLEEEQEIRRILAQLTELVAEEAPYIGRTIEALAELDLAFAKAKYAEAVRGTEPALVGFRPLANHPGSVLDLRQARHPLLDPESVVPIDVLLDDDYFILVITGPNTGGKTVSLKTVGLLACMAQAGLSIPAAAGSTLSVFDGIYADIGDEQSIEQSLSTFSSHMTNIIEVLRRADERSLVLLDELGAGTDPEEGSALARALLSHLVARRITALATTHYSELKVYAHGTPGVVNASVEFDTKTLSPTFELTIGLPGRSNALAIARRLGLAAEIVAEATAMSDPQSLKAEGLLADIKAARDSARRAQEEAQQAREAAEERERELALRLTDIEGERRQILNEAREQAQEELEVAQEAVARARRRMSIADERQRDLAEAEADLRQQAEALGLLQPPEPPVIQRAGPLGMGDIVWVPSLQASGEVVSLEGTDAEVQLGALRVRVPQAWLEFRSRPSGDLEREPVAKARPGLQIASSPGIELDLRGMRADEALSDLEGYLDEAFRAELPWVRIIHGKGTGALRQAVRQRLAGHPLVASFRSGAADEGSDGVTVIQFESP